MLDNIFILITSLYIMVKGGSIATKHSVKLAERFGISKYVIGFIVIAIISILPETFIGINAAIEGIPEFGLGTLFGSNVADLTLVFFLIIMISGRQIRIKSEIINENLYFPFILLIPLVLGLDGYFSRLEGLALIIIGGIFYYMAFKDGKNEDLPNNTETNKMKNILYLLFSMALLLVGAHFAVSSATNIANAMNLSPVLIGMVLVGVGTTLPEMIFSLKSVKRHNDSLAVGDILGTVLADATIVVGILAVISPFQFPQKIIYSTGVFMLLASVLLIYFMKSGRAISKRESFLLLLFWLSFVITEYFLNG